jgi:hypothetical protein
VILRVEHFADDVPRVTSRREADDVRGALGQLDVAGRAVDAPDAELSGVGGERQARVGGPHLADRLRLCADVLHDGDEAANHAVGRPVGHIRRMNLAGGAVGVAGDGFEFDEGALKDAANVFADEVVGGRTEDVEQRAPAQLLGGTAEPLLIQTVVELVPLLRVDVRNERGDGVENEVERDGWGTRGVGGAVRGAVDHWGSVSPGRGAATVNDTVVSLSFRWNCSQAR